MRARRITCLFSILFQLLVMGLVVFLLQANVKYTQEAASLVQVGMTPAEVEEVLGKPTPLASCVFSPIAKMREDGELKVDAIGITPSFYPIGPGLPGHILHTKQEEFPTYFGQISTERYEFRLAEGLSIAVLYDHQDRVARVFALPTTIQPGDSWVRVKWLVSQWLKL